MDGHEQHSPFGTDHFGQTAARFARFFGTPRSNCEGLAALLEANTGLTRRGGADRRDPRHDVHAAEEYVGGVSPDGEPASAEEIRALVARLSRPRPGGGRVIERAAIMAEGANSAAILDWIMAGAWSPEDAVADAADRGGSGVHGMRRDTEALRARAPRRYVSPPGDSG
jgi:hypothetical protein